MLLSWRGSGDAGSRDKIKTRRGFFGQSKARSLSRCLFDHLRRRLRNRGVSHMADLAMILVVGVSVPMADAMRGQQGQRKDGSDNQQPPGNSLRDGEIEQRGTSLVILDPFDDGYNAGAREMRKIAGGDSSAQQQNHGPMRAVISSAGFSGRACAAINERASTRIFGK